MKTTIDSQEAKIDEMKCWAREAQVINEGLNQSLLDARAAAGTGTGGPGANTKNITEEDLRKYAAKIRDDCFAVANKTINEMTERRNAEHSAAKDFMEQQMATIDGLHADKASLEAAAASMTRQENTIQQLSQALQQSQRPSAARAAVEQALQQHSQQPREDPHSIVFAFNGAGD